MGDEVVGEEDAELRISGDGVFGFEVIVLRGVVPAGVVELIEGSFVVDEVPFLIDLDVDVLVLHLELEFG